MLSNGLVNATRHGAGAGGALAIAVTALVGEGGVLVIDVLDAGPGLRGARSRSLSKEFSELPSRSDSGADAGAGDANVSVKGEVSSAFNRVRVHRACHRRDVM